MTTTQSPYVTSPSVLAQIAGLPDLSMIDIKALWKDLFGKDTPTHNRQLRKNDEVCTWTLVDEGEGWLRPQLALARSGLPGTLTNGNTPQGVFTIVGAGTATNPNIGPTPYLHSKLPVEAPPTEFAHADEGPLDGWPEAFYDSFLPASWRAYPPIKEAWLAGRAGRDELLIHGTTLNPAYYAGAAYFPGTPQQGCLIANEDWHPATGRLLASRHLSLAQAYAAAGVREDLAGFLVVVEVPGDGPVTAAEALALVTAAGR